MSVRVEGRSGLTLLELVVVMAIIGLMAAIAAPSLAKVIPHVKLNSAASQLANDLNIARYRGISGNFKAKVVFDTGAGTYTRWIDKNRNGAFDAGEEDILNRTMPSGVTFVTASTAPYVLFDPVGTADDGTGSVTDILVTLSGSGSSPETRQISVNRAMGVVKLN